MKPTCLSLVIFLIIYLWSVPCAAQDSITWMQFSKENYLPGTFDDQGKYLNGTELMRLTAYKGKLYAATSVFKDSFGIAFYPAYAGCQVLRKDSAAAPWRVDVSFGRRYLRTDALEKITFTHDSLGNPLPQPVDLLVAGIWDLGMGNPLERFISVAIRDDDTGAWTISNVVSVPPSDNGFASVRCMAVHRDYVTGAQYLIVGAANGGIFKGVYDPVVPGAIRWVGGDEVNSQFGRPHSMTVCRDTLYASFDYGGITVTNQTGGLFKRIDGASPSWQQVFTFYNPAFPNYNQTLRGITAVPSPTNPGAYDIAGAIESPPLPVLLRFQPYNNYQVVYEVNYLYYFTNVFGAPPIFDNNLAAAALNKLEPFENPYNGDSGYWVTTNVRHPQNPAWGFNGACFMYRKSNGQYDWGYVRPDSSLLAGQELRGIRTIERSPFANEPGVYYFGGYSAGTFWVKNTAWIYKGVIQNQTRLAGEYESFAEMTVFPNPAGDMLSVSGLPEGFKGDVAVYNLMGQMLFSERKSGTQRSVWIGHLTPGIYLIQLRAGDGQIIARKFIKE